MFSTLYRIHAQGSIGILVDDDVDLFGSSRCGRDDDRTGNGSGDNNTVSNAEGPMAMAAAFMEARCEALLVVGKSSTLWKREA